MQIIEVVNFFKHQHYKKRKPPWIKLYTNILEDQKIQQLKNGVRWLFITLLCLASRHNNKIPADFDYISRNCSQRKRDISKNILKLIDLKLIAIKRIAKNNQSATPETETETETEKKASSKKPYYKGQEMRKKGDKWWVLPSDGSKWLEFAETEDKIEWK